jgi:hypothetical protein
MNIIHEGRVDKGQPHLKNKSRYLVQLSKLEGKEIELIIRQKKSQRSLDQNSYYWGVVVAILGDHCGYDPEEMHEALKFKFLRKGKEGLETVTSTTDLNTKEFEDYLERIRRWASMELNCFIPQPNEVEP